MAGIQGVTISVSNNFFICQRILPRLSYLRTSVYRSFRQKIKIVVIKLIKGAPELRSGRLVPVG
jgi:hypothetical protein